MKNQIDFMAIDSSLFVLHSSPFTYMLEQALASIFEKLDDEFETTVATIVRIRNYGVARMMSSKICHHMNFLAILLGASHRH